jgi:hypothetical protein
MKRGSAMRMRSSAAALAAGALVLAAAANAAPYAVTHSDALNTNTVLPPGITAGQPMSTTFVLDNGGSVATNQTWGAATVQCVIFRFNSAGDRFLAVNYVGSPFTSTTTGSFATDGAGVLIAGTITWIDFPPPVPPNKYVTNVVGAGPLDGWFINANNDVVLFNPSDSPSVGYVNVSNDTASANWSNPQPAPGLCASLLTPQVVPTLGEWGWIVLSALLAMAAFVGLRRKRA